MLYQMFFTNLFWTIDIYNNPFGFFIICRLNMLKLLKLLTMNVQRFQPAVICNHGSIIHTIQIKPYLPS